MSFIQEFKAFAIKGNVIDLAVGVVIGASFGKIVTSLVDDIIMPPLGLIMGKVDFSEKYFILSKPETAPDHFATLKAAKDAGATALAYGNFINGIFQFLIVAFAIFLVVKQINRLKARHETEAAAAPVVPTRSEELLVEIRDALKKN